MSVVVESDGTAAGTTIRDTASGARLHVTCLQVFIDAREGRGVWAYLEYGDGSVDEVAIESVVIGGGRPAGREGRATCPECGGTGEVQLLTSVRPCSRGCKRR